MIRGEKPRMASNKSSEGSVIIVIPQQVLTVLSAIGTTMILVWILSYIALMVLSSPMKASI